MVGTGYKSMHIYLLTGFITMRYLSVYHSVVMQQTELSILGNTVKIGALVSQDYKQEVGHLFSGVS